MSIFSKRNDSKISKDEAERPFWISFSDLMSALMVLFLVAMSVAMISISEKINETEQKNNQQQDRINRRQEEINELLAILANKTKNFEGISLRGQTIDFGDRARFDSNSHKLNNEQGELLRRFIPSVLQLVKDPKGARWLKRIVVEGFADSRGNYLHNLNLSLQRSQRVMCMLLQKGTNYELDFTDRQLVRDIFRVSGASFNSLKYSEEESRRIELRLEFKSVDETIPNRYVSSDDDGKCPLD